MILLGENEFYHKTKVVLKVLRKHSSFVWMFLIYLYLDFVSENKEYASFFLEENIFDEIDVFLNELYRKGSFDFPFERFLHHIDITSPPDELKKEFFELIKNASGIFKKNSYYDLFLAIKNEFFPKYKIKFGEKRIEHEFIKKVVNDFYKDTLRRKVLIVNPGGGGIFDAFSEFETIYFITNDYESLFYSVIRLTLMGKNFKFYFMDKDSDFSDVLRKEKFDFIYADAIFPSTNPYSFIVRRRSNFFIEEIVEVAYNGTNSVLIVPAGFLSRESEVEKGIRKKIVDFLMLKLAIVLTNTAYSRGLSKPAILGLSREKDKKIWMLNFDHEFERNFIKNCEIPLNEFNGWIQVDFKKVQSLNYEFNPLIYIDDEKSFDFTQIDEEKVSKIEKEIKKLNKKILKLKLKLFNELK